MKRIKDKKKDNKRNYLLLGLLVFVILILIVLFVFLKVAFWIALVVFFIIGSVWLYKSMTTQKITGEEDVKEMYYGVGGTTKAGRH